MAKKVSEGVPHQEKFDHGVPYVGPTTAQPLNANNPSNPLPAIPTVRPSRFFEFIHRSTTNGKKEE